MGRNKLAVNERILIEDKFYTVTHNDDYYYIVSNEDGVLFKLSPFILVDNCYRMFSISSYEQRTVAKATMNNNGEHISFILK